MTASLHWLRTLPQQSAVLPTTSDFQDAVIDYYRYVAPEVEYFYCWHNDEIYFGFGQTCYVHAIDAQFLRIIPLNDEESEVD